MQILPVIPDKSAPTEPSRGTGAESGHEDFASMIPSAPREDQAAEGSEIPVSESPTGPGNPPATKPTKTADQDIAPPSAPQLSNDVIQSLLAEAKPQPVDPSATSQTRRVGEIEAALSATLPAATGRNSAAPGEHAAGAPLPAAGTPKPATPSGPLPNAAPGVPEASSHAGIKSGDIDPGQTKPTITPTPVPQSTPSAKPPHPRAGSAASTAQAASEASGVPAGPLVTAPAAADPSAGLSQPALSAMPMLAGTPIDPGEGPQDVELATPGSQRNATGNPAAAGNAAEGMSTGNGPTAAQGRTASATPETVAQIIAAPEEGSSPEELFRTAGAAHNDSGAKAPSLFSGVAANPTATQPGAITDMAAAFGGDLRLGGDGVRLGGFEQAFRGQPLQPASEQVAVQISRAVQQGADRITVHLKPASLGQITVDLEVGPENRLIAVVSAERPETLDLMQRDARALERALNDAGLKTDSGSLSFNLRGENGNPHADGEQAGDWSSFAAPEDADQPKPMPVYARTLSAEGGIDIRV